MEEKKHLLELSNSEYKVVCNALRIVMDNANDKKATSIYGEIHRRLQDMVTKDSVPKYYVVQGVFDDSISKWRESVLVKATSEEDAENIARGRLITCPGENLTIERVGLATKGYRISGLL